MAVYASSLAGPRCEVGEPALESLVRCVHSGVLTGVIVFGGQSSAAHRADRADPAPAPAPTSNSDPTGLAVRDRMTGCGHVRSAMTALWAQRSL